MANTENEPSPTGPFGPQESSDETRQAQHTYSNDTPTDVNINAVVARNQASTFDAAMRNFTTNQDFRDKIMAGKLVP